MTVIKAEQGGACDAPPLPLLSPGCRGWSKSRLQLPAALRGSLPEICCC